MVWNNRKIIWVVAGVVLVADSVWGYISLSLNVTSIFTIAATFTPMFFWSVVAFNIVMTLATDDDVNGPRAWSNHQARSTNAEGVLPSDRVAVEENNDIASKGIIT
ncbi:hypothetical protein DXG01_013405 [Tephrocybe rancida]|nr:hypothetical protein DXG01_013405 [Tephrocybe rancida]